MANQWNAAQMPHQLGKIVLVTGANSGIGLATALELARHGAHVLLACRTQAKGEATAESIRRQVPEAHLEPVVLDLASLASIRSFAAAFRASGRALDLLINNAGVMALPQRRTTADGFEMQLGTNHLGHFALTGLLVPSLMAAPEPRVVTVSSIAHRLGSIHFDNLQLQRSYTPWKAYRQSKLANLLFAFELDRRARAQHSILHSIAAHPGISFTNIVKNGPALTGLKDRLTHFFFGFMQSSEAGALPALFAATDPSLRGGEYIGPSGLFEIYGGPKLVRANSNALNQETARKLWAVSEELTGVVFPPLV